MSVPGWNDPPQFTHTSLDSHGIRQSKLTKRPTHPSSSSTSDLAPSLSPLCPPPPPPPPSTSNTLSSTGSDDSVAGVNDGDTGVNEKVGVSGVKEDYSGVVEGFKSQLEKLKSSMTEREVEEIGRRIEVMRSQMDNGTISSHVITKMATLFAALDSGDISEAQKIQVTLMVDHTSQVSQWMVGVKRLISKAATNKS